MIRFAAELSTKKPIACSWPLAFCQVFCASTPNLLAFPTHIILFQLSNIGSIFLPLFPIDMPQNQTKSNAQRHGRQLSELKSLVNKGDTFTLNAHPTSCSPSIGKRSRRIEPKQLLKPVRKSIRLQEIQRKTPERKALLPSPSATNSFVEEVCYVVVFHTISRMLTRTKDSTRPASFRRRS